jgi:formylglycine-generating enzyme required for sulfatase activity
LWAGAKFSVAGTKRPHRAKMKKAAITTIVIIILFLIAFGNKFKDKPKIIAKRKFSATPISSENMLRVRAGGHSFDIDIYESPNVKGKKPTANLNYDAAKRVCENAGKRLCTNEEWTYACAGKPLNTYSYGNRFQKDVCNSIHVKRKVEPSGSFVDCHSETGIYDMAGNLWEWIEPAKTGTLQARGGSFRDGELAQRCTFTFKLFRNQESSLSFDNFGVRCCRDASPKKSGK